MRSVQIHSCLVHQHLLVGARTCSCCRTHICLEERTCTPSSWGRQSVSLVEMVLVAHERCDKAAKEITGIP